MTAFLVLAAVALVAAYRVVTSSSMMHSALWLMLTFFSVAGLFVVLNAEFLAAAQVLIYVGAITTMIIFGIMLSNIKDLKGDEEYRPLWQRVLNALVSPRRGILPALAGLGFAGAMLWIYSSVEWPAAGEPAVANNVKAIGEEMFSKYIVPFEVASVILLVALVGAIVLAMKEDTK